MRAAQTSVRQQVQAVRRTRVLEPTDSTAWPVLRGQGPKPVAQTSQVVQTREEQKQAGPAEAESSVRSPSGRRWGMGR
jgi:hypothetical protein